MSKQYRVYKTFHRIILLFLGFYIFSIYSSSGDVSSKNEFTTNNVIVKTDTIYGAKNIQESGVAIDASNNVTGVSTLTATTVNASLSGNATTATTATNFSGSLSGDVTGTQGATVVSQVGGQVAATIVSGIVAANAATSSDVVSTIVKRDASASFTTNMITVTGIVANDTDIATKEYVDIAKGGTLLSSAPSSGVITITESGAYTLTMDLNCCIQINTNNVALDLNTFVVTGTCDSVISIEDNKSNVTIKNGNVVGNGSNSGITTGANNSNITIQYVNLSNFGPGNTPNRAGIFFTTGTSNSEIFNCVIETSSRCIELQESDNNIIQNCIVRDFTAYGIIVDGDNNCIDSCRVGPCDEDLPLAAGIQIISGDGNTIFNCDVGNIVDPSGNFVGINSAAATTGTVIDQCIVHDITSITRIYGINLAGDGFQVTNNHIFNLVTNDPTTTGEWIIGIRAIDVAANIGVISHNIIHDITSNNTATLWDWTAGISCRGANTGTKKVTGNRVFTISGANARGIHKGNLAATGANADIYGNSAFNVIGTGAAQWGTGNGSGAIPTLAGANENFD